jgi:transcription-repair coupling factor (superfamily II helicase)
VLDFGVDPARDFAPERAQNANVYEAVAHHVRAAADGKKVVLAAIRSARASG